jgi:hypothetical protein
MMESESVEPVETTVSGLRDPVWIESGSVGTSEIDPVLLFSSMIVSPVLVVPELVRDGLTG